MSAQSIFLKNVFKVVISVHSNSFHSCNGYPRVGKFLEKFHSAFGNPSVLLSVAVGSKKHTKLQPILYAAWDYTQWPFLRPAFG